jgi:hypothetical protein
MTLILDITKNKVYNALVHDIMNSVPGSMNKTCRQEFFIPIQTRFSIRPIEEIGVIYRTVYFSVKLKEVFDD